MLIFESSGSSRNLLSPAILSSASKVDGSFSQIFKPAILSSSSKVDGGGGTASF